MEHRIQAPIPHAAEALLSESSSAALIRRRQAIQSFLRNPAAAIQSYPDLQVDLLIFFSLTTNPHVSDLTGLPAAGREADFAQWEAARAWADAFPGHS
jgi:hypothetical protein